MNTVAISHLRYVPSVSGAEVAVKLASAEMKIAGMLSPSTDVDALAPATVTLCRESRGEAPPSPPQRLALPVTLADTVTRRVHHPISRDILAVSTGKPRDHPDPGVSVARLLRTS